MSLINQSAPTKDDNIGDYLPINWSWERVNGKHNLKLLAEENIITEGFLQCL